MAAGENDEAEAPPSIRDRMYECFGELWGVQALVAVTRDSINRDKDFERHCVLNRVYEDLGAIANDLEVANG